MGKVLFPQVCLFTFRGGGTPSGQQGYPIWPMGERGTPSGQQGVPYPADWGYPHLANGDTPWLPLGLDGPGVPPPPTSGMDEGTSPPLSGRQSSRVSTCYAAGGMPFAFTHEDFLFVVVFFSVVTGLFDTLTDSIILLKTPQGKFLFIRPCEF